MSDPNIELLRTLGPYLYSLEPDTARRTVLEGLFKQDVDLLETKYNGVKNDKTRKEEYQRYQEAFAKGLPAVAAGVIDAARNFQRAIFHLMTSMTQRGRGRN